MIFCHGGKQAKRGDMCALEFSKDLTTPIGEPFILFSASDNPLATALPEEWNLGKDTYCLDGPYLYRENGALKMIWSSFLGRKYHIFEATSEGLKSPWKHSRGKFELDGGHAMLFERLDGQRMIALHAPNKAGLERLEIFEY
ncbi:MAG: hypothetical protein IJZ32_03935 [Clostridia bacterium]|nr:hypothetical protein [Clostridia bacterium]